MLATPTARSALLLSLLVASANALVLPGAGAGAGAGDKASSSGSSSSVSHPKTVAPAVASPQATSSAAAAASHAAAPASASAGGNHASASSSSSSSAPAASHAAGQASSDHNATSHNNNNNNNNNQGGYNGVPYTPVIVSLTDFLNGLSDEAKALLTSFITPPPVVTTQRTVSDNTQSNVEYQVTRANATLGRGLAWAGDQSLIPKLTTGNDSRFVSWYHHWADPKIDVMPNDIEYVPMFWSSAKLDQWRSVEAEFTSESTRAVERSRLSTYSAPLLINTTNSDYTGQRIGATDTSALTIAGAVVRTVAGDIFQTHGSANAANATQSASAWSGLPRAILAHNEPDIPSQANTPPQQAADEWLRYLAPYQDQGVRVSSPQIVWNLAWMDQFMSALKAKGRQPDFMAVHWYGGWQELESFKVWVQKIRTRYQMPVWLTEYGITTQSGGTPEQVAQFNKDATLWMQNQTYVERAAWFGCFTRDTPPDAFGSRLNAFFTGDGALTPMALDYMRTNVTDSNN